MYHLAMQMFCTECTRPGWRRGISVSGEVLGMEAIQELRGRWSRRMPHLNERQRRLMVAAEALVLSRRGISLVPQAAGLLGSTNHNAIAERDGSPLQGRIRRSGGGRKSFIELDGSTLDELEGLMSAESRADRMSPLQWTCRSTRQPAGG